MDYQTLAFIGEYGPTLSFILAFTYLLVGRFDVRLAYAYAIGSGLNVGLNRLLKNIIKSPRPVLRETHSNKYGMPSGHMQAVAFTVVYLWRIIRNPPAQFVYLAFLGIVGWQRVQYGHHTPTQVIAGIFVGGVVALLLLNSISKFIQIEHPIGA